MTKTCLGLLAAAASLLAATADAQSYRFTLSGDYSATWTIAARPVPTLGVDGLGFLVNDVSGRFDGIAGPLADLTFYDVSQDGGLEIDDPAAGDAVRLLTSGPQLYSGTVSAPEFLRGPFVLTRTDGTGRFDLVIADADAAAVPEPASWALLLLGTGLTGSVFRLRRGQAHRGKRKAALAN